LAFLGRFLQALQRKAILAQSMPLLFELVGQVVDDLGVEILTAEEGVAMVDFTSKHAVADLQDRDVEGAAAEVETAIVARRLLPGRGQGGAALR